MPRKSRSNRRSYGAVRRLPSGRYQARHTGPDGAMRAAPRTFATRDEADTWIATQQTDVVRGSWRAPELGAVPLRAYIEAWIDQRVDLRPRTVDLYIRTANRWIFRPMPLASGGEIDLASRQVRQITTADIREWYAAVTRASAASASTRQSNHGGLRSHPARDWARANGYTLASTGRMAADVLEAWQATQIAVDLFPLVAGAGRAPAVHAYRLLRAVLSTATLDGMLPVNPCRIPGAGQITTVERVPATPEQIRLITAAMPAPYCAAVSVAAWSGLRAGELFALRRRDIDMSAGTLRVDRALIEIPGQPMTFGPPKTDASRRTVHLPRGVADELVAHLALHVPNEPNALVFGTASGQPVRAAHRSRMFARARLAAGRPDLHWHDLRHTGATLAAHTGASVKELQRRLGHATARAAMIYQHASDDRDRALAERLNAFTASDNVVPLHRARPAGMPADGAISEQIR